MAINESPGESFPTSRYRLMLRISALANGFAWILLVCFLIGTVLQIYNEAVRYEELSFAPQRDFWLRFKGEPLFALSYIGIWLKNCLLGVYKFVVLKGIAMGLNMIVETDMNRLKAMQEAENE
jgi:hypothetical protein